MNKVFKFKKILTLSLVLIFLATLKANSKSIPGSFANLAEKLMPSVVNISTTQTITTSTNPFPFEFPPGSPFEELFKDFETPRERQATSLGSGFIIDKKGIVVTNNHVIGNADDIIVTDNEGKEYKAKVMGADPYSDLAVLKIDSKEKFDHVKFGNSNQARVGDWVVAIGNPFGFGGTVTAGIISARNRDINLTRYDDFIQTDASINKGNSGGPLFNTSGEVVGINTAIIAPGAGSIGIGFAIPSNQAKIVINQLIEFGETKRGWLGVRIQEVTKEIAEIEGLEKPKGALVASVSDGSPAKRAGLKPGDIILDFDNKKVNTMRDLPKLVALSEVGKSVEIKIWREKRLITKKVILGRLESSKEYLSENKKEPSKAEEQIIPELKISVRDLNEDDKLERKLKKETTGVVITNIQPDSPIVSLLRVNDIIIEIQKEKILNSSSMFKKIKKFIAKGDKTLLLTIFNSQNQRRYLGIKLE